MLPMSYFHLLLFLCFCCYGGETLWDVEGSGLDQDYVAGAETVNGDHEGPWTEGRLKSRLLEDYHKGGRPVLNISFPLRVELGVTLLKILELDEARETLTAILWFNFHWQDEFLLWNSSETKIADLRIPTKEIWIPDIKVYNSISRTDVTREETRAVVTSTGSITWIPAYQLTTTCKIDTVWFPFDTQQCDIKLGSWVYDGYKIDLQLHQDRGMDLGTYYTNKDWELLNTTSVRNEVIYECCPAPYLDLTFTVNLRRRTFRHLTGIILPSVLLTLLAILGLLIPATRPTPRFLLLLSALLLCSQPTHPSSLLGNILGCCVSTLLILLLHSIAVIAIAATRLPCLPADGVSPSGVFTVSRRADAVGLVVYLLGFLLTIWVLIASAPHLLVY